MRLTRSKKSSKNGSHTETNITTTSTLPLNDKFDSASSSPTNSSDAAASFHNALSDPDVVERVRILIKNAHVFKLPPRQSASVGWRGADWKEKVWQGNVKVVERGDHCAIVLVDRTTNAIFAVSPYREGTVDRCVDSSRYFVLRIENAQGKHMYIGMAFNERNDAFDFNTALQDHIREQEAERTPVLPYSGPTKDYSLKQGEKIRVNLPKIKNDDATAAVSNKNNSMLSGVKALLGGGTSASSSATAKKKTSRSSAPAGSGGGGFLAPPGKDTPRRDNKLSTEQQPPSRRNHPLPASPSGDEPINASSSNPNNTNFPSDPFAATPMGDNSGFDKMQDSAFSSDPFFR